MINSVTTTAVAAAVVLGGALTGCDSSPATSTPASGEGINETKKTSDKTKIETWKMGDVDKDKYPGIYGEVIKLNQKIYGKDKIDGRDVLLLVPKPEEDMATIINFLGLQPAEGSTAKGKKKGGTTQGLEISIQRREDTRPEAITPDAKNPKADLVFGYGGTYFYAVPSFVESDYGVRGFGYLPLDEKRVGEPKPVVSIVGESPSTLYLYMPAGALQDAKYSSDIVAFTAESTPAMYKIND